MKLTQPFYITFAQYTSQGLGNACDPTDFDGAVDAWAECMENNTPATVYRMEPSNAAMIDVTRDTKACVAKRMRQRNQECPEWAL